MRRIALHASARGVAARGGAEVKAPKADDVMSNQANPAQAFTASPAVVFRELEDGAVLLDLESGVYFGLDEVGARVWTLLVERGTPAAVCEVMLEEFEVEPAMLADDVLRLVGELQQNGLVRAA